MSSTGAVGGSSNVQANKAASNEPKLSSAEVTSMWNELTDQALKFESGTPPKTMEKSLGATKSKAYKEKMGNDLKDFLAKNPNATEKDVQEFFKKQNSKNYSYLIVTKMQEDAFFNKVLQKAKESQSDRWD